MSETLYCPYCAGPLIVQATRGYRVACCTPTCQALGPVACSIAAALEKAKRKKTIQDLEHIDVEWGMTSEGENL